jgi:hypothetical protein
VSFEFETQEKAEPTHKAMQAILATTKLITTHGQTGDQTALAALIEPDGASG